MSIRQDSVEELAADFAASPSFKHVYKNIVPVWTKVNNTPSVAILYSEEYADRDSLTSNKIKYNGTILVYIYNKQSSAKYEDILSDLIEEAQTIVMENTYLQCNTVECIVSELKKDGGTVHPWAIAQLKIRIKYIHRI